MKNARKVELEEEWKKLVTQAVTDDLFKTKLIEKPIEMMKQFELTVPEGVEVLSGHANTITLVEPKDSSEALKSEIRWWRIRLDMIQEFGQAEVDTQATAAGPPTTEEEDV